MNSKSLLLVPCAALGASLYLVGCGGDDTSDTTSSATTMDSPASSGQGGASSTGAGGQGGSGGDTSATASSSSGASSSSASSSSASSSSASSSSASSSSGGGDPVLNGCTLATAKDMTGMKSVKVTDISKWTFGHQACVLIMGGTQVVWDGDFTVHPLTGGESGKADVASPISQAMVNAGTATALIPVAQGKAYPYYCTKHNGMQGVIYTK